MVLMQALKAELTAASAAAAAAEVGEDTGRYVLRAVEGADGPSFRRSDTGAVLAHSSAQHAAEMRAHSAVEALDAAQALSKAQRDTRMHARGVRASWFVAEFAQLCRIEPGKRTNLTTADVIACIIRPATRATRCRYVDLLAPEDRGRASVFCSHAHAADISTLIAAVKFAVPPDVNIWLDLFAVRQWPGNRADLDFRPAVLRSSALLCVLPHLPAVSALPLADVQSERVRLPAEAAERCPLCRIWCVAEVLQALGAGKPAVMLAAGQSRDDELFEADDTMLPRLLALADVRSAVATVEADRRELLAAIERSPGFATADSRLRCAISGARHAMNSPQVLRAALADSIQPLARLQQAQQRVTALRAAAALGLTEAVRVLLAPGSARDLDPDNQAIVLASAAGHAPAVGVLMEHGAEASDSACFAAAEHGQHETLVLLLAKGNPFAHGRVGTASLMKASYGGHAAVVALLLERGVSVNATNQLGQTALMGACASGHLEAVSTLLRASAEVDCQSETGQTSLILASHFGHRHIVLSLVAARAECNTPTHDGTTALLAASRRGHDLVVAELLKHGAKGHYFR